MAPLTHAVRLIDRQERNIRPFGRRDEAGRPKPLGHDVHQTELPGLHAGHAVALLLGRKRPINKGNRDPKGPERIDLILHQCNQRRNDERHARKRQCGKLVAQTFPPARRHDAERVPPLQHGAYDLLLTGTKTREVETFEERGKV